MKKKSMLILTILLLMVTCLPFTAHAASPKLNKKTATITVGKTVQLKVKNNKKKVVWSSSNKKVASVSKKGLVKGVKPGSCKITAKVGKKKYVCRITVKTAKTSASTTTSESTAKTTPSPTPTPESINVEDYMKTVTLTEANINDYIEVTYDFDTHGVTVPTATGSTYIKDKQVKDGWYPLSEDTDFSFKLSTTYWNGKNEVISEGVEYNYKKMRCTRTLFHNKTISNFQYSFSDLKGTIKYVNKKAITNIIAGVETEKGWTHARAELVNGKTVGLAIFYLDGRYF